MARVPRYICDVCKAERPMADNPLYSSFNISGYGRVFDDTCPRCSNVLHDVLDKVIHALQESQRDGRDAGVQVTITLAPGSPNKVKLES